MWICFCLQFEDEPGPGTLLILYSAILTRGTNKWVSWVVLNIFCCQQSVCLTFLWFTLCSYTLQLCNTILSFLALQPDALSNSSFHTLILLSLITLSFVRSFYMSVFHVRHTGTANTMTWTFSINPDFGFRKVVILIVVVHEQVAFRGP